MHIIEALIAHCPPEHVYILRHESRGCVPYVHLSVPLQWPSTVGSAKGHDGAGPDSGAPTSARRIDHHDRTAAAARHVRTRAGIDDRLSPQSAGHRSVDRANDDTPGPAVASHRARTTRGRLRVSAGCDVGAAFARPPLSPPRCRELGTTSKPR